MFAKGFGLLGWHKLHKQDITSKLLLREGIDREEQSSNVLGQQQGQVRGTGNDQRLPRALESKAGGGDAEALNCLSKGGCPCFPDRFREKQFSASGTFFANISLASGLEGVKQGSWQSVLPCWELCACKFPEEHPRVHLDSNLRESQTCRLCALADLDKEGHKLTQELVCHLCGAQ